MQTVMVAIAQVTKRDVVQRVAELPTAEATHAEIGRPFIRTEWVGGLETHARQLLQHLERAGTRRRLLDVAAADGIDLTGLTFAEHGNGFGLDNLGKASGRI